MPGGSSPDPFRARGDVKISNIFNQLGKFQRVCPRSLAKTVLPLQERASGEMAEWLKAHAWKACVRETVPWVRIPLSPPFARFCAPNCDCARDCARDLHRRTYRYAKVSCRAKRPHGLNAISASGRTPNDVLLHWNAGKKDRAGICFAGVCARLCKLQLTGLPHDYRVRPAVMLWRTG